MSQTFIGGPLDMPSGVGMDGKMKSQPRRRKRLTGLTDELRAVQERDGLLPVESRDRDGLNDYERAEATRMMSEYEQSLDAAIAAKLPDNLARLENWQGPGTEEFVDGTRGLTVAERAEVRREGERVVETMDRRDFAKARKEQEKRQQAAGAAHEARQRQGELLDFMQAEFQRYYPDLAALSPEIVQDHAARHARDLNYTPTDFYKEDGSIDLEGVHGFLDGTAESLRAGGWGEGAKRLAGQPAGSSTVELLQQRQKLEGFE